MVSALWLRQTVRVTQVNAGELTRRMGAAVSWMDKMWVMLCCANSSLSRASGERKVVKVISHISLSPITILYIKFPIQIKKFQSNDDPPPPLNSPKQIWPYG